MLWMHLGLPLAPSQQLAAQQKFCFFLISARNDHAKKSPYSFSTNAAMDQAGINKVAEAMVAFLGSSAAIEARKKCAEALDSGDVAAFRAWHHIMKAARSIAERGRG